MTRGLCLAGLGLLFYGIGLAPLDIQPVACAIGAAMIAVTITRDA